MTFGDMIGGAFWSSSWPWLLILGWEMRLSEVSASLNTQPRSRPSRTSALDRASVQ